MSPCTFVVTAMVTGTEGHSAMESVKNTYHNKGIKGFYAGGTAMAFR